MQLHCLLKYVSTYRHVPSKLCIIRNLPVTSWFPSEKANKAKKHFHATILLCCLKILTILHAKFWCQNYNCPLKYRWISCISDNYFPLYFTRFFHRIHILRTLMMIIYLIMIYYSLYCSFIDNDSVMSVCYARTWRNKGVSDIEIILYDVMKVIIMHG